MNIEVKIISQVLDKFAPRDVSVQRTLGLTERQAELFWIALNAIEGDDLLIANFNKLAGKFNKFPSVYINELRKKKVIERGSKRGQWLITRQAITSLSKLLDGKIDLIAEKTPSTQKTEPAKNAKENKPGPKPGRKINRKPGRKPSRKQKASHPKIDNMTIGQIKARLEVIDMAEVALNMEREEIFDRLSLLVKDLNSLKQSKR